MLKKPLIDGEWESKEAIARLDAAFKSLTHPVSDPRNRANVASTINGLLPILPKHVEVLRNAWDAFVDVARRRTNSKLTWDRILRADELYRKFHRMADALMRLIGPAGERFEVSVASIFEVSHIVRDTFHTGGKPRFMALRQSTAEWAALDAAAKSAARPIRPKGKATGKRQHDKLLEFAGKHWAPGTDKYKIAVALAEGDYDYTTLLKECWPGQTHNWQLKRFNGTRPLMNSDLTKGGVRIEVKKIDRNTVGVRPVEPQVKNSRRLAAKTRKKSFKKSNSR